MEERRQEQIADQYGEEQRRLRARQRLAEGQLRAQAGASGLDLSGSMMDILSSGQEAYDQDKLTLLNNQRNDNYDSRVTQTNYLNEGKNNRAAAANVQEDARRQIAALDSKSSALKWGTILGTASSLAGSFLSGGSSGSSSSGWGSKGNPYTYKGLTGSSWNAPLRLQTTRGIQAVRRG